MLEVVGLSCGYGESRVVHNVDFAVGDGGVFALLGANGAGKSSTLMAIAGHVQVHSGRVFYAGADVTAEAPQKRIHRGIALVPEGRRLFADLSVEENLTVGGYHLPKSRESENRQRAFDLFPRLAERRHQKAGSLSGGEQQMLAIGRALMAEPGLLLVDELSLGLMPKAVDLCYGALDRLRQAGLAVLLVEQNTHRALEFADQVCVLESGRPVWRGTAADARNDAALVQAYLGITSNAPARSTYTEA
jgi:branched-chain amino acid transport system ATP-binding protein